MSMTMNSGSAVQTPLAHGRHDLIGSDRAAIDSAPKPVNVPISRTRWAPLTTTSASSSRARASPLIIPGVVVSWRVASATPARCGGGGEVCATA